MKNGTQQIPKLSTIWQSVGTRFLPFADAASDDLPLGRLLRLFMFQLSVGMAAVLLTGTLNRVMIIELGVSTSLVAVMVAIPVLAAPFRALIGHRSDTYRSFLGWRRVPFIWLGTLAQFGGLSIMPFALLILQSQTTGPDWAGPAAAAVAFLLTGLGMHTTQTAGLALAADLSTDENRPRVVALAFVVLLIGMIAGSIIFSLLLVDFTPKQLIQVIQGAAVFTVVINVISMWKQEVSNPHETRHERPRPTFRQALDTYRSNPRSGRLLLAVGLGSAAFSMQDVLLEPYGAQLLDLSVSQTTLLTGLWAMGTLMGFALAGQLLSKGYDMHRVAALGVLAGIFAFTAVIFSGMVQSDHMFRSGAFLIGFGGGLFAVGLMLAAIELGDTSDSGFAIGAWGAVQATAIGCALACGGLLRDLINALALSGSLGPTLNDPSTGYYGVYYLEIAMLFATLVVLGPLTSRLPMRTTTNTRQFGLTELPG
ncbi:MAG: BCD family MFS transporter [Pseudomonadota bacterium]